MARLVPWWLGGPLYLTPEQFCSEYQCLDVELDSLRLWHGVVNESGLINAQLASEGLAALRLEVEHEQAKKRARWCDEHRQDLA